MVIDTSYHRRRIFKSLEDPEYRVAYERAGREIDQIDAIVGALDTRREELGWSKADLARAVGKNPASVRRLFSTTGNPELRMIAALATALGGQLKPVFPGAGTATFGGRTSRKKTPT